MRVLGIGHSADLGDIYLRLLSHGHEVRLFVADDDCRDVLDGLVPKTSDWAADLAWVGRGDDGLILFEDIGWGDVQDRLRREGFRVIGGSALGDRLEQDRAFGQRALAHAGVRTAATRTFTGFDAAIDFVRRVPGRYVLKLCGEGFASTRNYVGVLPRGEDLIAALEAQRDTWPLAEVPELLLMDHVQGVEVGVGAFFDGVAFRGPANLDWEHKRFFPGDLGELTGEMGTLVTYRGAERLERAVLAPLAAPLREAGHVGYVNVNTIVNDDGIWPLELTCRFGYPGFAILGALHDEPWDALFERLLRRDGTPIATHDGWAVGVVLTVPPFPYRDGYARLSKGAPFAFGPDLSPADHEHLHVGEVKKRGERLVLTGVIGYAMVVTGRGSTVEAARAEAYRRARGVVLPNVRYRTDIGASFLEGGRDALVRSGVLSGVLA